MKSTTNQKEAKTRRGNIVMRPSTWDNVQKILRIKGGNFNELVSTLLENFVEENAVYLRYYDKMIDDINSETTRQPIIANKE